MQELSIELKHCSQIEMSSTRIKQEIFLKLTMKEFLIQKELKDLL